MAKQIYSFDEDKMVDVLDAPPAEKKEDKVIVDKKEPEEELEKEVEDDKTGKEEKKVETPADKTGPEDEEEEEEEILDEEATEKKENQEEEGEITADEVIKDIFSEKYGIESEAQFQEILDHTTELIDDNKKLSARVAELEKTSAKPVFKSENQEAIFNLLKDYDPDRIPDGMNMVAALVGMDVNKTDPKLLLEQKFIMEHPELNLERARRKFQRDFDAKYVIDEDSFEDPNLLKEKKKDIEEDIEIEAAQARKFIKEKQKEFKNKSEEVQEEPKVNEEVQEGIARHTTDFDRHMDGLHTLTFQLDEADDKSSFNYKFSNEELNKIKKIVDDHLKSPSAYDAKGKLIGGFDPEQKFQQAAFLISGQKMISEALKSARTNAQIIKAEDIGKKKPMRKAKSDGQIQDMSIDAQTDRLMAKKKADRQASGR